MAVAEPFCVIMNPRSGDGATARERRERIARALDAAGVDAQIRMIRKGRSIAQTTEAALQDGHGTIVAAGGDGTISGVADAMLRHMPDTAPNARMGVLPLGTFNFFARSLDLPQDLDAAAAQLTRESVRPVRLGTVNGRVFLNNVSLGLYPSILDRRETIYRRWGRSRLAAHWSTLLTLTGVHRAMRLNVHLDGAEQRYVTPLVFVAASAFQLQAFNLDGVEAVRNGRFALFRAPTDKRLDLVRAAWGLAQGRARKGEDFLMDTAKEIVLHTGKSRNLVALDGERDWVQTPIRVAFADTPLNVLAPPKTAQQVA